MSDLTEFSCPRGSYISSSCDASIMVDGGETTIQVNEPNGHVDITEPNDSTHTIGPGEGVRIKRFNMSIGGLGGGCFVGTTFLGNASIRSGALSLGGQSGRISFNAMSQAQVSSSISHEDCCLI